MLECMVVPNMTMVSEYVASVIWNDGLKHPLLHELPCEFVSERREPFILPEETFDTQRIVFLERKRLPRL